MHRLASPRLARASSLDVTREPPFAMFAMSASAAMSGRCLKVRDAMRCDSMRCASGSASVDAARADAARRMEATRRGGRDRAMGVGGR